jgi:signal transduction histidine kinase
LLPDLQKIHAAGKHLLALINDILDLSKIEAGKTELYLETFSIVDLIAEVVETTRPLVNANANILRVDCPTHLGAMHADVTRMRQSLFNLLSNAAKFTERGEIALEVSRVTEEDREWIRFRVSDTGIGLTTEQLTKLFQTFSQADTSTTRKFGGSGLGLALTRSFCQLMGGDVTVSSVPGESSTFTIMIPASVSELVPAETHSVVPAATRIAASRAPSIAQYHPDIARTTRAVSRDFDQAIIACWDDVSSSDESLRVSAQIEAQPAAGSRRETS